MVSLSAGSGRDTVKKQGGEIMKQKLSALFAALALALCALPMAVSADNANGNVAKIVEQEYPTLQAAVDAAAGGAQTTITLIGNTSENVNVPSGTNIVLDLAGFTVDGGTTAETAALTNAGTVVIRDSSADKTGTIKRSDNGPSGTYYTVLNNGTMTFEGGNVRNNSGSTTTWSGSSLICNGLSNTAIMTIKGGYFGQDNFITIKNEEKGTLNIEGGVIESKTQAVQNWENATISGGQLTGEVTTWTYYDTDAVTNITRGNINGNVIANQMDYKGTVATKKPVVKISGDAVVNGTVFAGKVVTPEGALDIPAVETPSAADIDVTGGTFSQKIPDYAWGSGMAPTLGADGKYTMSVLYVAQVDGNNYTDLASALTALDTAENNTLLLSPSHPDVPIEVNAPLVIDVEGVTVKGGILQPSANFARNGQDGSVITVSANNVTLDGVTVDATGTRSNASANQTKYAVQFYNVTGGKVNGGVIRNDGWAGILLNGAAAEVSGTTFDLSGSCYAAIELSKGVGVSADPNLTLAGTVSFANSNINTADANRLIWVDLDPNIDNESIPAGMVSSNKLTVKTSDGNMTYDANGLLVAKPAPKPQEPWTPNPTPTPAPAAVLDSTPKTGAVSLAVLPLAALALAGVGVALRKRR